MTTSFFGIATTLFFMPFLQEDVAIVTASYFIAQDHFPVVAASLCLYLGIVVSDILFYLLGRAARRFAWAQRWLIKERVQAVRHTLQENMVFAVAIVRVVPGLLAPTFLACGWFGLSFRTFLFTTMAAAALYLALMLSLLLLFGETLLPLLGHWWWGLALLLVALRHLFTRRRMRLEAAPAAAGVYSDGLFSGLPRLSPRERKVAPAERLPGWLFYLPLALAWLLRALRHRSLTLPTVANPAMLAGGLWGESKSALMQGMQGELQAWAARYFTLTLPAEEMAQAAACEELLTEFRAQGWHYPVVVKPDVGWQGYGVCVVADEADLRRYVQGFPVGQTMIVQELVPWAGEAGIYYIRMPGEPRGRVVSMTFRYFPHVVGDGVRTVRQLIRHEPRTRFRSMLYLGRQAHHHGIEATQLARVPAAGEVVRLSFIGSIRAGGLYQDASDYITAALSEQIERLAQAVPEFYFGRFDVRFATLAQLQHGEAFKVIEVNGAGSEPIHVWDPRTRVLHAYRELLHYQGLLFQVAAANRRRGYLPMPLRELYRLTRHYSRLLTRYPASC